MMKKITALGVLVVFSTPLFATGGGVGGFGGVTEQVLQAQFNGTAGKQSTLIQGRLIHWMADAKGKLVKVKSLPKCSYKKDKGEQCFLPIPSQGGAGG